MIRRPPGSTRTVPLVPYTTPFRSLAGPIERHRGIEAERGSLAFLRIGSIEHARAARKNDDRHPRPFAPDATHQRLRRFQAPVPQFRLRPDPRSEEHTSDLQSLMRIQYAVFCLKKKRRTNNKQ